MHLSRFSKMSLFKCGKTQLDNLQTIDIAVCCNFLKRKFYSSPQYLIRRIRKGYLHSERGDVDNPKEENISPKQLLDEATTFDNDKGIYPGDVWHSDPYEHVRKFKEKPNQNKLFIASQNVDPLKTTIILFPGQGTQFVGMGKKVLDYPNVKNMYERASEILGYDLLKISCEGPASSLNQTKYQQPAILLASLAAIEKLRHEEPSVLESCVATAGFSVGEITALTFAGVFNFENAVRLVQVRAEAMQITSELNRSGMMTVFYGHDSKLKFACSIAKEYCQKSGVEDAECRIANYLYPSCKVVAGSEEALQFIIKNKDDFKLRKIKRLNVSGAFHTDLMKPAAYVFKEALKNTHISNAVIPVYSNVDGGPYKDNIHVLKQLPKQIYLPVRWEQILHALYQRPLQTPFPKTFECGPGTSLKTILKMVNRKASDVCVNIGV